MLARKICLAHVSSSGNWNPTPPKHAGNIKDHPAMLDDIKKSEAVLLSLHAVNSYILLTANLDDMHFLAKQIAESPVASQINKIIRRAATMFKNEGEQGQKEPSRKSQMLSDPKLDEEEKMVGAVNTTEQNQRNLEAGQETKGKTDAVDTTDGYNVEVWKPDQKALAAELTAPSSSSDISGETKREQHHISRRDHADPGFVELGRNASFYLNSIKKILNNV